MPDHVLILILTGVWLFLACIAATTVRLFLGALHAGREEDRRFAELIELMRKGPPDA